MNDPLRDLRDQYTRTLNDYLAEAGEANLHHAYELGRQALAEGLGILEIASMHHHARSEERRVGKECRSRWSPYH